MEPETRYAFVGAVVLALFAAAVAGFAWLSSVGPASDYRFYTIRFERQSLEGVQVGGDVAMRGIKVGRVEDYKIVSGNINVVEVTVRVDRATPVSDNTVAILARNFVTGIARIDLVTPGSAGPPLVLVPDGERFPVIAEGTSELAHIAESANRLATTTEVALANLNELLSRENRAEISATLSGLSKLVDGLNQRLTSLDDATRSLRDGAAAVGESSRRITTVVEETAARVDPLARDAGDVLKETRGALTELRSTLGEGRTALGSVSTTLQDFSRLATALESQAGALERRIGESADIGVLELRATAQELRSAAEMLSRTLERLQDPRSAILGPGRRQLGPGEESK